MKKCSYCSEEIQDSAKKCRFCGEWLKKNIDSSNIINNKEQVILNNIESKDINIFNTKKNKYRKIIGLVLAFSLVIIWFLSSIIQWLLVSIGIGLQYEEIIKNIMLFLYLISILIFTPYGIYILVKKNKEYGKIEINNSGEKLIINIKKKNTFVNVRNWLVLILSFLIALVSNQSNTENFSYKFGENLTTTLISCLIILSLGELIASNEKDKFSKIYRIKSIIGIIIGFIITILIAKDL